MELLKRNIKWIILVIILMMIVSSVSVYATAQYYATQIEYKDGKSVADALNELFSKEKYTTMNKAYLEAGTSLGNVEITENNLNQSIGLSITGAGNINHIPSNRWEKEIDFTNLSILSFYAKKGADHGAINIRIDNEQIYFLSYSDMNGDWKKYFIDLTKYTGIHKLLICGGWGDSTGNSNSNTQYCDIRLY